VIMAEANPKKQQMEYIAISILVVVALFIGLTRFKKKDNDDEVFSRKAFNKKWKEVEVLESEPPHREEGIKYGSAIVKRMPFKGPLDAEKNIEVVDEDITLPSMQCQGMIWKSIRPQVIIDNKVYDIGDKIAAGNERGVKVKDITKKGVHLVYEGKLFIVGPNSGVISPITAETKEVQNE